MCLIDRFLWDPYPFPLSSGHGGATRFLQERGGKFVRFYVITIQLYLVRVLFHKKKFKTQFIFLWLHIKASWMEGVAKEPFFTQNHNSLELIFLFLAAQTCPRESRLIFHPFLFFWALIVII